MPDNHSALPRLDAEPSDFKLHRRHISAATHPRHACRGAPALLSTQATASRALLGRARAVLGRAHACGHFIMQRRSVTALQSAVGPVARVVHGGRFRGVSLFRWRVHLRAGMGRVLLVRAVLVSALLGVLGFLVVLQGPVFLQRPLDGGVTAGASEPAVVEADVFGLLWGTDIVVPYEGRRVRCSARKACPAD